VLRQGINDPAAENVTEQLVTSLGERYRFGFTPEFLVVHAFPSRDLDAAR
jgi:hypothetical protein